MTKPFAQVRRWRAKDAHTGIDIDHGVPYTYRHLDGRTPPPPRAEVYRIETFIPFDTLHGNIHYVPGRKLDAFFAGWDQVAETVIDVRPLTVAEALAELTAFRADHEQD